ncbi:MAG: CUAEP/CCAEP-tail radical SAM protein [Acidobacteria bacterium]|nr:CUAEP/CCAEP-tail radical SAM protein [Acidobacteriota bacterium]
MRSPGEILLISCYELGHQPMGLALPLGYLEASGYHPAVVDVSVDSLDSARITSARLAAISVPMHTALRLGVRVAQRIRRENPACHICFHGHYALLNSRFLLDTCADSILAGECEESFVRMAHALAEGSDLEAVVGLALRGKQAEPILTRQRFVQPSRQGLRALEEYASLEMNGKLHRAGYVEASRGCLHLCRHCPIPPVYGGRFFVVPRELVLVDIRRQVEMGAVHITFGDADFLNGPGHALALAREMHRLFPSLTFDFTAKIEHLLKHRELLWELRRLGAVFVVSAVESLNETVLQILDKGHNRSDVTQALALCREAGLVLRPSLLPFTPWSGLRDYRELLEFVVSADLVVAVDPVQFSVRLLIPPGSFLLRHPRLAPHLGELDPEAFGYAWKHPDPRMDFLQRRVAATVERAGHLQEPAHETYEKIRRDYFAISGESASSSIPARGHVSRRRLPRLTESWFC